MIRDEKSQMNSQCILLCIHGECLDRLEKSHYKTRFEIRKAKIIHTLPLRVTDDDEDIVITLLWEPSSEKAES